MNSYFKVRLLCLPRCSAPARSRQTRGRLPDCSHPGYGGALRPPCCPAKKPSLPSACRFEHCSRRAISTTISTGRTYRPMIGVSRHIRDTLPSRGTLWQVLSHGNVGIRIPQNDFFVNGYSKPGRQPHLEPGPSPMCAAARLPPQFLLREVRRCSPLFHAWNLKVAMNSRTMLAQVGP